MVTQNSLSKTFEILEKYKINIANYKILENKKDLKHLDFPIYIKIDSQKHKSKLGGVKKCNNFQEALNTINSFLKKFPNNLLILQEEIMGKEMFVGIKKDKVFGKILVVGAGGTKVESKKDIGFRVLPVKKSDIKKMIKELKIYPEIKNGNKHSLKSLINLISKISELTKKQDFKELDLNPVILTKTKAIVVDSRIF